jgi:HPt (histidine-containing phosphotransfer) domain-containing protein
MNGFDQRLADLRRRFLERTRKERMQLASACQTIDREELRRVSHGLAGSAGIFGFADLGRSAQTLEEAIYRDAGNGEIRALAEELIALLDRTDQLD